MQLRHVMSTALAALPAMLLTACLSTSETGPVLTLDASAVNAQREQVAQVLRTPVLASVFDTAYVPPMSARKVGGSIEVLLARASALVSPRGALRPSLSRQRAAVAAVTAPGSWLPAELRGKTYVRVNGAYVSDDSRQSEAPVNGVRIVLYERLAADSFGTTPIGYLDLADISSGTADIGTAKIVDGGGTTQATLKWTTETAGSSAGTYAAAGTLGATGKQIVLNDTITVTTNGANRTTIRAMYRSAAPFASTEVVFVTPAFDADSASPQMQMGMFANGHEMYIVPAVLPNGLPGSAVVIDGYIVAYVDPDSVPKYITASGRPPAADILAFFDATAGLAARLPLASSIADDAMKMANRLSY